MEMKFTKNSFPVLLSYLVILLITLSRCNTTSKRNAAENHPDTVINHPETSINNADSSLSIKTLTGTLNIKPFTHEGNETSDYWIYIDQTLVEKQVLFNDVQESLNPVQLFLIPGEYKVEVAVYRRSAESEEEICFPFSFTSKNVVLKAGEVTDIALPVDIDYEKCSVDKYEYKTPDNEWYNGLLEKVKEINTTWINKNPVAHALNDVYIALLASPPLSNKVVIALPEEYGGWHEYDATQVRLIVRWIKHDIWDWFPSEPSDISEDVRKNFYQLEAAVKQIKGGIDTFNHIAEQLEQVNE
jgi:hypothetical protein